MSSKHLASNSLDESTGQAFGYGSYDSMTISKTMDSNNDSHIEMKNDQSTSMFYSSGSNLTLHEHQRSWIDPWEVSAGSDKFYQKHYKSPTKDIVSKSIEPNLDEPHYKYSGKYSLLSNHTSVEFSKKFGPWDGVMAGCLLNIFGVIMFLRVGWIIGQCGIFATLGIICISTLVTTLTAVSMSAICTNGTIFAGGAYYIISRTLGPEFGGSVGMLFAFANMVAISMYLIGFSESLVTNLKTDADGFSLTGNDVMDVRIWSNILLVFVLILALVGLKYVIKAQLGLLCFISITILTLFLGSLYQKESGVLYGVSGYTNGNLSDNLWPDYKDGYDFWSVLAIFFPAVTGIMAGANISGDLRNPSNDIPKGTLTAIFVSSIVYAMMTVAVGAVADREELIDDTLIMTRICVWDYIIYLGIYAATLSSAIASLVGAPRILMAVADDDIIAIPGLSFFAKTDKHGNPIRGYFLSFVVAFGFNCIGELNLIAPLISQFFIVVYLLINFACFIMEISRCPGWRPSFKYFNGWTSLFGSVLCLIIMFMLHLWYAIATLFIVFALYLFISYTDPVVSWGGSFYSRSLYKSYRAILNLAINQNIYHEALVMNWRPSFLVIHYNKNGGYKLNNFVESLRKDHSLIFAVNISIGKYRQKLISQKKKSQKNNNTLASSSNPYLPIKQFKGKRTHLKGKRTLGFQHEIVSDSYRNAFQSVIQMCGLGVLKPNTLIIKLRYYANDECVETIEIEEYVEILRDALLTTFGVIVCCGLCDQEDDSKINWTLNKHRNVINNIESDSNIIDVWWMVDDGGLILLLPYIMCLCRFWSECKVRINIVTNVNDDFWAEKEKIQELIRKFRLPFFNKNNKSEYNEPRIIKVSNNKPSNETISKFETISKCKYENVKRQNVLGRWLRLSELLFEYSSHSSVNIVTLPVPTNYVDTKHYMAVLTILSDQERLPPTILMRGNGEQSLTFFSE